MPRLIVMFSDCSIHIRLGRQHLDERCAHLDDAGRRSAPKETPLQGIVRSYARLDDAGRRCALTVSVIVVKRERCARLDVAGRR